MGSTAVLILTGLGQDATAIITVPFHNQAVVNDSGVRIVEVYNDDLALFICEVTYCHGTQWSVQNVFSRNISGHDNTLEDDVTQEDFTMYLIRSFEVNNKDNEFNITSLLRFYVNETKDTFEKQDNEITIICSNPTGNQEDRIIVKSKMYEVFVIPKW